MDYETVKACMNQKIVLLKKIRELSREIELHCCESNLDPTKLPNQRQVYLDRLKKCESLLSAQVERQTPATGNGFKRCFPPAGKAPFREKKNVPYMKPESPSGPCCAKFSQQTPFPSAG